MLVLGKILMTNVKKIQAAAEMYVLIKDFISDSYISKSCFWPGEKKQPDKLPQMMCDNIHMHTCAMIK